MSRIVFIILISILLYSVPYIQVISSTYFYIRILCSTYLNVLVLCALIYTSKTHAFRILNITHYSLSTCVRPSICPNNTVHATSQKNLQIEPHMVATQAIVHSKL
jgi:hypothetical protein